MKVSLFFIFLSLFPLASFEEIYLGAKPYAMGEAFTAADVDIEAIYFNPALLTRISSFKISITSATLFEINEVKRGNLAIAFPFPYGTCGISSGTITIPLYKEQFFMISYAKEIIPHIFTGFNLKYLSLKIESIKNVSDIGIDVGIFHKLNKKVHLGLLFKDINNPQIKDALPKSLKFGIFLKPQDEMGLAIDVIAKENTPPEILIGSELKIFKNLEIRYGLKPKVKSFSFGLGFFVLKTKLDYAYIYHPILSSTHILTLIVEK